MNYDVMELNYLFIIGVAVTPIINRVDEYELPID